MNVFTPLLAAAAPVLSVVIGWWLNRKVREVHVLVNSQMNSALNKIEELERRLDVPPAEKYPIGEEP